MLKIFTFNNVITFSYISLNNCSLIEIVITIFPFFFSLIFSIKNEKLN